MNACSMVELICQFVLMAGLVLVAVNSQSYPRFEFREDVLTNNSFIVRGASVNIGEARPVPQRRHLCTRLLVRPLHQ